jgi:hypothetical protein
VPRASWKGHLRLSLVSCPIYLTPATTRTKPIRLNRIWAPSAATTEAEPEDEPDIRSSRSRSDAASWRPSPADDAAPEPPYAGPATRVSLRPHDPIPDRKSSAMRS